jgi:hypothetical protein
MTGLMQHQPVAPLLYRICAMVGADVLVLSVATGVELAPVADHPDADCPVAISMVAGIPYSIEGALVGGATPMDLVVPSGLTLVC